MDFRLKTRRRAEQKPEYEDLEKKYPLNVTIYRLPPTEDIKIQEFEELALERLKVLRILEQAGAKNLRFLSDNWKEYVNAEFTREGLKNYLKLCTASATNINAGKHEAELQARRRDYLSHFILRLAYCRNQDLRRWFLTHEMEFFKYKFSALNSQQIKQFLELYNINYQPVSEEEKNSVKEGLYDSTKTLSIPQIDVADFYKVPFTKVLDLVRYRRCFLKKGFAYVCTQDFCSVVAGIQSDEIEAGLTSAQNFLKDVEGDERVFYLLKSLHTSYTGKDYTINNETSVPVEALDQLSKKSYPLCMRACHEHLRATHHMKHNGRMQYGLFLKGIGVTVEDSVRFWREEFTKKMDADKFAKSYEYNILHNYGKKGSMVNYTPYSCLKIIPENIVPGEVNGCPYKLYDTSTLKTKLASYGLSAAHVQDVSSLAAKGHYQLACGKYFQFTHNAPIEIAVNHPNQYFEESQILMGTRTKKKDDKTVQRKTLKSNANDSSMAMSGADDDELWNIAETPENIATAAQENINKSQNKKLADDVWDDDLDLSVVTF